MSEPFREIASRLADAVQEIPPGSRSRCANAALEAWAAVLAADREPEQERREWWERLGEDVGHQLSGRLRERDRPEQEKKSDGEICQDCELPVARGIGSWWRAPDELWNEVAGWPGWEQETGGMGAPGTLCPRCFYERAQKLGKLIFFQAVVHGAESVRATDPVRAAAEALVEDVQQRTARRSGTRGPVDPSEVSTVKVAKLMAALAADREPEPVTGGRPLSRAPEGGRPDYVQRMRELAESVGERNERIRTLREEWPVRITDEMVRAAEAAALPEPPAEGESE